MTKHRYGLLFVLLASILLSLFYIPYFNVLSGDKEIYRYIGQVMLKGGVPYRDVFDHKPPLIFFLNWFGLLFGNWGQWIIDCLLALLATFLFFRLSVRHRLPYPWLLPLLFNLMLRDFLLCLGMGMTREYTTVLLVIFFCVFLGQHRYRFLGLGLLSGLIFFMQQDQVLPLLPFFVYAFLFDRDRMPLPARLGRTALGFLAVALIVVGYFAWNHALQDFWRDAFQFNFTWYTTTIKESFGDHLRKLKTILDFGNYEVPFLVAMTLGVSALFFRSRNKTLVFLSLLAALLSISTEFMGGRDIVQNSHMYNFTHYFLPLAASLPILLFTVFAFTDEPAVRDPRMQGIFGFLVCASIGYTALQHGTHLEPMNNDPAINSPESQWLRQQRLRDYQFYEFGNNDFVYLYNEFGIIGPSPWVYQHFYHLYDHWDNDHAMLHSIGDALLRHRTTYVLDFSIKPGWFRDPAANAWWHAFLQEHYQPVMTTTGEDMMILWKLKGTP